MSVEKIKMPGLGESVHEAAITMWLVKPGDVIEKYDPIAEVVSDKVTSEIPSEFDGTVQELFVDVDETVAIGTEILSIEVENSSAETVAQESDSEENSVKENKFQTPVVPEKVENKSKRARYSPVVMRIAQEKGIDLQQVSGSGNNGRITKKDLLNFAAKQATASEKVDTKKTPTAEVIPKISSTFSETRAEKSSSVDERVPADGIRKTIAKKMVQSATEIPHAWLMVETDVSNIVKLRNEVKDEFKQQEGLSLSYFPFFVKAVVQALKQNPKLNTSWDDGTIIYHKDINISIAVAGEENLYVPVIHHADQLSLVGITKEAHRLANAVHTNQLTNAEMQGGTFTVNNTGTFGSIQSMGIINYPQAAILQVEAITKRMVPVGENGFKAADMINLCLSIDHRILDGLQAGRFLQDVKTNLAKFNSLSDLY